MWRSSLGDSSSRSRLVLCLLAVWAAIILYFTVYDPDSGSVTVAHWQSHPLAKRFWAADSVDALHVSELTAALGFDYASAVRQVYQPRNLTVCTPTSNTPPCWLHLATAVDCSVLFDQYENTLKTHTPVFPTPRRLPSHLRDEFLLQNFTTLSSFYVPQPDYSPNATTPEFTRDTIKGFMADATAGRAVGHYGEGMLGIYPALRCHPIKGLKGAIFGTEAPWLEGVLFALGAAHLTTIEFRTTISHLPNHKMLKPLEWVQGLRSGALPSVDFAFSFSSWEHDGLGRYGDPIDPWGDVKAVQRTSCYVQPGGLLYFAAPASAIDQLMYNAHRVYGPVRLPLLTANWAVLGVFDRKARAGQCGSATCNHLFKRWRKQAPKGYYSFQPVVVLRNMRTTPCAALEGSLQLPVSTGNGTATGM